MKTSTKDLKKIANSKINSLELVTLEKLKKQHLRVLPNDIINIMTLLAFSKTKHNESLTIEDVAEFFDEKGNFLGGPYTTFSCLYGTLDYINYATLNKLGREKYLNLELDGLAIYNFQIKILLEMLWSFLESYHDEFPDFPERESDLQRILIITQLLYPSEFKKLIHSATEFIDDKNGPHIDATNKNGILTIKLNHKSSVYAGINEYDREYAILNFFAGGLILQGFGKFTHKTPKHLRIFLEHNPNLFNGSARITTGMRWDDRRTGSKIKKHGKSFRESSEEYGNRHADLANAWNDGLFGLFNYEVHQNFTTLKWKYPDFFILDSIEDIQNDHTDIFSNLLDTYEGTRYPSIPYGMEFKFHELKNDMKEVVGPITKIDWNNKEEVLEKVEEDARNLEYASKELKGDKEVALAAVKRGYSSVFNYISKELQADKEVLLAAVKRGYSLKLISEELRDDKEVVLAAVNKKGLNLEYASEKLRGDKEVALPAIVQNAKALKYASEELRDDKEVVLAAVKENRYVFKYASEKLRGDKEVVMVAVKRGYSSVFNYISKELQADKEVLLAAIKNGYSLKHLSEELRNDKEVALNLEYASKELKGDKEVALAAVRRGYSLKDISEELRDDKEVVLTAITQMDLYGTYDIKALKYASKELRNDKEVVLTAITQDIKALKYASKELRNDKEVVLAAIKGCGLSFKTLVFNYISEELRDDKEVVLAAVQRGYSLKHISEELRDDKEVVLAAVKNGYSLKHISEELRDDKEVVLAAVYKKGLNLEYVSKELKDDKEVVLVACDSIFRCETTVKRGYSSIFKYISKELQADKEVLLAAVKNGYSLKHISEEIKNDPTKQESFDSKQESFDWDK